MPLLYFRRKAYFIIFAASGLLAIGLVARGLVAIGLVARGLVAIGLVANGLVASGLLARGWFAEKFEDGALVAIMALRAAV